MNLLNEHYPRKGETPMLPMDYDQKKTTARAYNERGRQLRRPFILSTLSFSMVYPPRSSGR
jgi:hypothetical protein